MKNAMLQQSLQGCERKTYRMPGIPLTMPPLSPPGPRMEPSSESRRNSGIREQFESVRRHNEKDADPTYRRLSFEGADGATSRSPGQLE